MPCIARQNCRILSPTFLWYKIVFPSSIPRESHPRFSSTKLCFLCLSQGKGRKIGLHTVLHHNKGISFINFQLSSISRRGESHPRFSSTKLCFLRLSQGKGRKIGLHTVLHDDKGISFINFQKRKTNSSSFLLGVTDRRVKKKLKGEITVCGQ